ncbi:hypothetical protein SAMN05216345_11559 [Cupriavidus sp. YR651]|uniref:DUF2515 family protein n=1 Tax=Cupriavidus sp. YR651 TaxID=1855315 RepID=UPI000883AC59|nr:hypothetical protein [Cupriavidus sp. YR651]SDD76157.1 hypothetical protein SAMN05216345_11559 [Cupriavidus sp. YR651]
MSERQKCIDRKCPVCYPNWKEEEAAAKTLAEEDRQDCIDCWRFFQKQAEAIVAVDDPMARNRRINAAYARLWLDDRRFQWAGLAAFASKQVGCGLLNAAELVRKSNSQRDAYQLWERSSSPLDRLSPYGSPRMPTIDQTNGAGAHKVHTMLAKGNTALFLDIWPLHMFYKKFGLQRFESCLPARQQLRGSVLWPIGDRVRFAEVTKEVRGGFRAINVGDIQRGVELLAWHEQANILQSSMYDDPVFAMLMRANQLAWALHLPTGSAQEVQLILANQCTVSGANAARERFSKHPLADLSSVQQRMAFVLRAAQRFDELLRHPHEKYAVESSLFLIADGRWK